MLWAAGETRAAPPQGACVCLMGRAARVRDCQTQEVALCHSKTCDLLKGPVWWARASGPGRSPRSGREGGHALCGERRFMVGAVRPVSFCLRGKASGFAALWTPEFLSVRFRGYSGTRALADGKAECARIACLWILVSCCCLFD